MKRRGRTDKSKKKVITAKPRAEASRPIEQAGSGAPPPEDVSSSRSSSKPPKADKSRKPKSDAPAHVIFGPSVGSGASSSSKKSSSKGGSSSKSSSSSSSSKIATFTAPAASAAAAAAAPLSSTNPDDLGGWQDSDVIEEEEEEVWPPQFNLPSTTHPKTLPLSREKDDVEGFALSMQSFGIEAKLEDAEDVKARPKSPLDTKAGAILQKMIEEARTSEEGVSTHSILVQLPTRLPFEMEGLDHGSHSAGPPSDAPISPEEQKLREAARVGASSVDPHGYQRMLRSAKPGEQMATIRIHKSGRVSVIMGNTTSSLTPGVPIRHACKLVAVDNGKTITDFGNIQEKVVISSED